MPDRKHQDPTPSGGLNEAALAGEQQDPLGGSGGSAGGGTRAGKGEPDGGQTDRGPADPRSRAEAGGLAAEEDAGIVREANALGPADGSLADAASGGRNTPAVTTGPTGAESVGARAGRGEAGSGPPQDRSGLGGGGPLGQQGGAGPSGSDSGEPGA